MANSEHIAIAKRGANAWKELVSEGRVKADFSGAEFGDISFKDFSFPYGADFSNTRFNGNANFENAEFSDTTTFTDALFYKSANFCGTKWFKPSDFDRAHFQLGAYFDRAAFYREHSFEEAIFGCEGQVFSVRNEAVNIRFISVFASFKNATIFKSDFSKAIFHVPAYFNEVDFGREIEFNSIKFISSVDFVDATFGGPAIFNRTTFHDSSDFSSSKSETARFPHAIHFVGCIFHDRISFKNRSFKNTADFKKCIFYIAPNFHGAELHQHTIFPSIDGFLDFSSEAEFSYRTLKLAMNKHQAHSEELMFFALEMQAKRNNEKAPTSWLYALYEIFSFYGQSISRPAIGLLSTFLAFSPIYWVSKYGFNSSDSLSEASSLLAYSLGRTIPVILPAIPKNDITLDLIGPLATAAIVGLHSLLSGAMLFLLALGLRNRFRLKA